MDRAREIKIDGQDLKVKGAPEITLQKTASAWKVDRNGRSPACTRRTRSKADRRRVPRPVSVSASDRHAVECRSPRAGAALDGPLRPPVGKFFRATRC
jgi:hypothetical protein